MLIILDERLIHAQILYHWCKTEEIKRILLYSPSALGEPIRKMLIDQMMPPQLQLIWIKDENHLTALQNDGPMMDCLILVDNLEALHRCARLLDHSIVILSNLMPRRERALTAAGVRLAPDERASLLGMHQAQIMCFYQPLPDFQPVLLTPEQLAPVQNS